MAAWQSALQALGARPDVFATLDATRMTPRETTLLIVLCACSWMLLEGMCHLALRGMLARRLAPGGPPADAKARAQLRRDVTSAVAKMVSMVHNAIQIPVAIAVLLQPQVNSHTIYGYTRLSIAMCIISAGYFLYDLVICLARFSSEGAAFLVHAACCLFVYSYASYKFYLTFFGAGFLLWELSTPFVHARWYLLKTGRGDSRLYVANGLAMMVVFFCCRPLWGTWLSYKFFADTELELAHPRPHGFPASGIWGYRIANVALNLLNYLWFAKIAQKVVAVLAGRGEGGAKRKAS